MKKIPVGQTIVAAYRFTFVGLENVIGLIWLPIIVLTVADYFINGAFYTAQAAALDSGDASRLGPMLVGQLGFQFVELALKAMIAVAICRQILKPLQRPLWLRFSLGGTELRFVAGTFALAALMGLVGVLCMIIGMVLSGVLGVGVAAGMAAGQQALGFGVLIGLLFSPALIYVFVRLGGLMLPATVMDGGIGLERSWQLVKGNVLRMLGVTLATGVPVTLVLYVVHGLIVGPDSFNPHFELMGDQAAMARHNAQVLRQTAEHLPLLEGLEFIMAPLLYGLVFSAPAFAYKALTQEATPAP
jgi:hypothetical protein